MLRRMGAALLGVLLAGCSSEWLAGDVPLAPQQVAHEIYAHRGDREAKLAGWDVQAEWDNSVQAVALAQASPEVERVEIDLQLNRHPESLSRSGGLGLIFVHHDASCTVVDAQGKPNKRYWFFNETYDVNDDHPDDVRKCAETLESMLTRFPSGRWVLEMKSGEAALPAALLDLLRRRTPDATVSSIDEALLIDLRNRARAANYGLELVRVHGYLDWVSQADLRKAQAEGFNRVAFGIDLGQPFTSSENIAYAKSLGLKIGAWHWQLTSCESANDVAYDQNLDFMMTDCITDMASHPGW